MPSIFTNNEYIDMLIVYGMAKKNCRKAADLYRQMYPDRRAPAFKTFFNLEQHCHRSGCLPGCRKTKVSHNVCHEQKEVEIMATINIDPYVSTRSLAQEVGCSKSSVHRVLKKYNLHPYKATLVQGLRPSDFEKRMAFILNMSEIYGSDSYILSKILWTDESKFCNNGEMNRRNTHYWADQNPNWLRETQHQVRWNTNVWCGILNGKIIGPYFYDGTLTGERYLNFLSNELPILLEEIPLSVRDEMWLQQDGAPPHNSLIVREFLDRVYPERCIGTNGPMLWPPRSPDMTLLDFFLWGYLKDLVYATQPASLDELKERIKNGCENISPEMIHRVYESILKRYEYCIHNGGSHFENKI